VLSGKSCDRVWTAGGRTKEKIFIWKPHPFEVTRYEAMSYTNWYPQEPNNSNGWENCLELYYDHNLYAKGNEDKWGKWNDEYCFSDFCFLCEING